MDTIKLRLMLGIVKIDLEVNDHWFSCDCWRPKGARMFRALGKLETFSNDDGDSGDNTLLKTEFIFHLRLSKLCKSDQYPNRSKNLLRLSLQRQRSLLIICYWLQAFPSLASPPPPAPYFSPSLDRSFVPFARFFRNACSKANLKCRKVHNWFCITTLHDLLKNSRHFFMQSDQK